MSAIPFVLFFTGLLFCGMIFQVMWKA